MQAYILGYMLRVIGLYPFCVCILRYAPRGYAQMGAWGSMSARDRAGHIAEYK